MGKSSMRLSLNQGECAIRSILLRTATTAQLGAESHTKIRSNASDLDRNMPTLARPPRRLHGPAQFAGRGNGCLMKSGRLVVTGAAYLEALVYRAIKHRARQQYNTTFEVRLRQALRVSVDARSMCTLQSPH